MKHKNVTQAQSNVKCNHPNCDQDFPHKEPHAKHRYCDRFCRKSDELVYRCVPVKEAEK